jgi:tetratricopeptide (TPR) repeat protein
LAGLDERLEGVLDLCPEFYPAWFHRGENMLRVGKIAEGETFIDRAFDYMAEILEDEDEFRQELAHRMGNLEKLLRYDLAAKYMEKAVALFPDTAANYDDLAFYILRLPDRNKSEALRMQEAALDIEPDNDYFINNLGWIYLMMGKIEEAEDNFQKAIEYNLENSSALDNRDAAEYMREHKLNYLEYLLRPAGMDELKRMLEYGDFEELTHQCGILNGDRVEAFKMAHLQKGSLPPHEILDVVQPFEFFMKAVAEMAAGEIFLYENVELLHERFKEFLYEFVIDSDHIDGQLLDDIDRSLVRFYDFLQESRLVTPGANKRFIAFINPLIKEFSGKLEEYNRLRHDVNLETAQRDEAAANLFGIPLERDDHF